MKRIESVEYLVKRRYPHSGSVVRGADSEEVSRTPTTDDVEAHNYRLRLNNLPEIPLAARVKREQKKAAREKHRERRGRGPGERPAVDQPGNAPQEP